MALDTTMLARHLAKMIADLPATLVWSGQTLTDGVTASEIDHSRDLEMPGYYANNDLECVAPVASFSGSTTPDVGDTLTVDGVTYRVGAISEAQDGVSVRLMLKRE